MPRSEKRKRPNVVSARLSAEELRHVVAQADSNGITRASYLHQLVRQDMGQEDQ